MTFFVDNTSDNIDLFEGWEKLGLKLPAPTPVKLNPDIPLLRWRNDTLRKLLNAAQRRGTTPPSA